MSDVYSQLFFHMASLSKEDLPNSYMSSKCLVDECLFSSDFIVLGYFFAPNGDLVMQLSVPLCSKHEENVKKGDLSAVKLDFTKTDDNTSPIVSV